MRSRALTIAVLSVSLGSLGLPPSASAQGVVTGAVTAGPVFNVPNDLLTVGFFGAATAERRSGRFGLGTGLEVIHVPAFAHSEATGSAYGKEGTGALIPIFAGIHSRHPADDKGIEVFAQAGVVVPIPPIGYAPEFRIGVDRWTGPRRAVRVALHGMRPSERLLMVDVGVVFR
jgi:hypothetical protein